MFFRMGPEDLFFGAQWCLAVDGGLEMWRADHLMHGADAVNPLWVARRRFMRQRGGVGIN